MVLSRCKYECWTDSTSSTFYYYWKEMSITQLDNLFRPVKGTVYPFMKKTNCSRNRCQYNSSKFCCFGNLMFWSSAGVPNLVINLKYTLRFWSTDENQVFKIFFSYCTFLGFLHGSLVQIQIPLLEIQNTLNNWSNTLLLIFYLFVGFILCYVSFNN